jgi:hypothetical protein
LATPPVYVSTQTCTRCKAEKPFTDYYRNAKARNGLASWCKACVHTAERKGDWHSENRDKVNANWTRSWSKAKGLQTHIKEHGSCAMCDEDHPMCLDFHHVDPSLKSVQMAKCHSVKAIIAEASKCVLLCRNCHAKAHAGAIDIEHLEPMTPEYVDGIVAEYALKVFVSDE